MSRQIAVVAPGGVGSVIGGLLSKSGERVWSIDQWPEHVQALKANGLRIALGGRRQDGELADLAGDYRVPVRGYHVYQVCTLGIQFDVVFLAAKAHDALWLARLLEPHLKPDGVIVALQGGDGDAASAEVVGQSRLVGCVYGGSAWLVEPDVVWQSTQPGLPDTYLVGELDGADTSRVRDLAAVLDAAGPTRVTSNLRGARWTRLVYDAMTAALAAVSGIEAHEAEGDEDYQAAAVAAGREAIAAGTAAGRSLEPLFGLSAFDMEGPAETVALRILRAGATYAGSGHISAARQDLARNRPSEVDQFNGLAINLGRGAGVATPVNTRLIEMYERVRRGELVADRKALRTVLSSAPA